MQACRTNLLMLLLQLCAQVVAIIVVEAVRCVVLTHTVVQGLRNAGSRGEARVAPLRPGDLDEQ